jgi:hypothetical protein
VFSTHRKRLGLPLGVLCLDGNRKLDSLKRPGSHDPSRGQNLSALIDAPDHQLWPETEPEKITAPSQEARQAAAAMHRQSQSHCALNFKVGSANEQDRRPFIDDVLFRVGYHRIERLFS